MPMLESNSPRLVRWIARALSGDNPPGAASAAEIAYIRGEAENLPGDVPSQEAFARAWEAMDPRIQALAIGGRPDVIDQYAEAAAVEAAREG